MKEKSPKKLLSRRELQILLEKRELDKLEKWAREEKNVLTKIIPFSFERDELIRWRAIEAMGKVAAVVFEKNPEEARNTVRKLLWSMNDESGSVGWHAPEVVGEILCKVPPLLDEYGIILASHLGKSPFERGTVWAVMKMARVNGEMFYEFAGTLEEYVNSLDPYIRAYAAKALSLIHPSKETALWKKVANNKEKIHYYDFLSGKIVRASVKEFLNNKI